MKKILLFIDSLGAGGAQRQMVGLAVMLKQRGYDVMLSYYHPLYFYKPFLDVNGVHNELIPGAQNKRKRLLCVRRSIKAFRPDTVISYLDTPNIIICLLRATGLKFRLIVSERNTSQNLSCFEKLKFFFMRRADVIVPNSYSQEAFIIDNFSRLACKVKVITNFVDTEVFSPSMEQKIAKSDDKCRILVVGRVTRQKNVIRFLQAVKKLHDDGCHFRADWYGYKDEGFAAQCSDFVVNEHIEDIFQFHDPSQDIVAHYRESDIFCLPSLYEGFPNVLCEAMCCGLPVTCSRVCDNPSIIEDGKNGFLFNPLDVDDMVDKLKRLILLPANERQSMAARSRVLALEMFSEDVFIEKYESLL